VVFGLPDDWVEGEKIRPEKIKILKNLSKKLEISPVGFVVVGEAIVHRLKTGEGVPPTAIIIGLGEKQLSVTLVKLGKILGTYAVQKSDQIGEDITEGLSRFDTDQPFPPRILLYGQEKTEKIYQALVDYDWPKKKINFLHLPKVEMLASDFDIQSVALAGGQEVAKTKGIKISPAKPVDKKVEELEEGQELEKEKEESVSPAEVQPEMMGFVLGKDVTQAKPQPALKEEIAPKPPPPPAIEKKPRRFVAPQISLAWLKQFGAAKDRIVSFAKGIDFSQKGLIIVALVLLFLLIAGGVGVAVWWYWPHAQITLLVEPQVLEKDFTVQLNPDLNKVDKESLSLPAEKVSVALEGEKTKTTTGSKLVGEPAKGEVKIYNGTSNKKVFPTETVIASSTGLEFTLDEEVTIASQSGTAADPKPGEAEVGVTAVEIGTEGNLAADTEFTVANFSKSDYVAKNESAFSGGTSREVQVVSQDDQDQLLADLKTELENQAQEKLIAQAPEGKQLIGESTTSQIVEEKFNQEVEESANEVSLNLKMRFLALTFSDLEFKNLIEEEIRAAVPEGFEYQPEESKTSFELQEVTEEGVAIFKARFQAQLIPQLNLEEIKNNLAGKQQTIGRMYLENLTHVASFEAKISPKFPKRLSIFPRLTKNIKIEVKLN
jgi:hypothetical protein